MTGTAYNKRMRRLLQFGTFIMVLAAIVTPLSEAFDRWDAPGLSNDTEFGIFALVLFLVLVLLVSKLVALRSQIIVLTASPDVLALDEGGIPGNNFLLFSSFSPDTSPPLRV